eukprot:g36107.t1
MFGFLNFDWLWKTLQYLGLANKSARVIFLGLDAAGKTTLLHLLKYGTVRHFEPTGMPGQDEIKMANITFSAHDLGGHQAVRRLWDHYCFHADAIVFVVDATDHKRMEEAREELAKILASVDLQEKKTPILILGNKIDREGALPEGELAVALGLQSDPQHVPNKKTKVDRSTTQPVQLFMTSFKRKTGHIDGFRWLSQYL